LEYLIDYGLFLAKTVTIVVALILIIGAIANSSQKQMKGLKKGSIKVNRLNDHIDDMRNALRRTVMDKPAMKLLAKQEKKARKEERKTKKAEAKQQLASDDGSEVERKPRVYVLNFKGNIPADGVDALREEITAVLSIAEPRDEVLLRLESPGGMVHAYGLASSQLMRIKNKNIPLTICVDKVAASGGYMMACLADKLVSAPFAIIGSIGVLVQLPNFNRVLKKNDVDFEQISAGEFKRTLSTFGEITDQGREKVKEDVETIHHLFKTWVKDHRPSVEIDKIATGETWVGTMAKERYMVDEIKTSDECIVDACANADVFEVEFETPKSLQDKFGRAFATMTDTVYRRFFQRTDNDIYQ
jgi:serine protease SohB